MSFSSLIFIFLFLPLALAGYYLAPRRSRNLFLLAASLIFYTWGGGAAVLVLLASTACNYCMGLLIHHYRDRRPAGPLLGLAILFNVGLLGFYKYANFLLENISAILPSGTQSAAASSVVLPLAISYYTFHALSYQIDIYRRSIPAQKNPVDFALYLSFFPKMIAGPITRCRDMADAMAARVATADDLALGIRRFIIGLGKKVLIANTLAVTVDQIFELPAGSLSTGLAWLGLACYTLQIYFDFSGYSDMAIGLGRMFGFRLPENFDYPYAADSVRDFWKRWHMTLSTWFRDYLYIPLGGNRRGPARTYLNLVIVFLLCGLWHGAKWNFVIWGLIHGLFLAAERTGFGSWLARQRRPLRHAYALLVVSAAWVFFRAETLAGAMAYLQSLAGVTAAGGMTYTVPMYLTGELLVTVIAGAAMSMPLGPWIRRYTTQTFPVAASAPLLTAAPQLLAGAALGLVFFVSVAFLAGGTYNPFIYLRF